MLYPFNYNSDPSGPVIEEITIYKDKPILIKFAEPMLICYDFGTPIHHLIRFSSQNFTLITEPLEMCVLSTTNPAHSLGEFTSFLNYYIEKCNGKKVCINSYIIQKMPYLYQLILQFIPIHNIVTIESNVHYIFSEITFRRNHHFVHSSIPHIPFEVDTNILHFNDLSKIQYSIDCTLVFNKVKEIYHTFKHRYTLSDDPLMIIKTSKEKHSVSIGRAIEYPSDDVIGLIKSKNIKIIEISQFTDIYEYICTIYHAKYLIFSYGGPMCTNRFFCNPLAQIIILCNLHYKPEYDYGENHWHINHAMLAPVKSQHFILDFDNKLTIDNLHTMFSLLASLHK